MIKSAFLILAYCPIELIYKQIDLLDSANHFFFIHVDKKFPADFNSKYLNKPNVFINQKRIRIEWGGFSIVEATLELLTAALKNEENFDFFILMSGQCMPVKSNQQIDNFLKMNENRSFIEFIPLPSRDLPEGGLDKYWYPVFFDQLGFLKNDAIQIGKKKYEIKKMIFRIIKNCCKLIGYHRKLPESIRPCYGSQWWAINRNAANYIIDYLDEYPQIKKYFKYTWAPDELLFQSILYSSPINDVIVNKSLWYIDWDTNGPPKTLSMNDYEKIVESNALFARKFDPAKSSNLIDILLKNAMIHENH